MWLFTNTGFVSAVSNGQDLMVRSRDRESLEPLAESAKPRSSQHLRTTTPTESSSLTRSSLAGRLTWHRNHLQELQIRGRGHPWIRIRSPFDEGLECDARG
jgi:hypothetical protein